MSNIISDSQKRAIYTALPSAVTISGTVINASKIWSNQRISSYPTITLNISRDGGDAEYDVTSGQLYYDSTLTVHILTKDTSGFNGAVIAEALAASICSTVAGWTTPLTGDVRIFDPRQDIGNLGNLGYDLDVYDYVLSITLYHS